MWSRYQIKDDSSQVKVISNQTNTFIEFFSLQQCYHAYKKDFKKSLVCPDENGRYHVTYIHVYVWVCWAHVHVHTLFWVETAKPKTKIRRYHQCLGYATRQISPKEPTENKMQLLWHSKLWCQYIKTNSEHICVRNCCSVSDYLYLRYHNFV